MFYLWLAIMLATLLLEMGHPGLFFFLSFACGSGAAALTAYLEWSLTSQIILFLLVTVLNIVFLKKIAHKLHHPETRTNMQALIGNHALVIKTITPMVPGQVKINGEIWTARSINHTFEIDSTVIVSRVIGSHVIVTPLPFDRKDLS